MEKWDTCISKPVKKDQLPLLLFQACLQQVYAAVVSKRGLHCSHSKYARAHRHTHTHTHCAWLALRWVSSLQCTPVDVWPVPFSLWGIKRSQSSRLAQLYNICCSVLHNNNKDCSLQLCSIYQCSMVISVFTIGLLQFFSIAKRQWTPGVTCAKL